MYALRRGLGKARISLIGVSAAGALASNGVQLVLAYYFVFGESIRYAAAPILALGIVRVVDGYGGLAAAERIISPLFKPLLGIPGICGLAFITSLQSTDGAAGMTKELYDAGHITDKERTLFCQLQFSGDGTITNYFSSIAALFALFTAPIALPLVVIFLCKGIGVTLMRLLLAMDKSSVKA
jgi:nucleoside recognition membrane protein YjiH